MEEPLQLKKIDDIIEKYNNVNIDYFSDLLGFEAFFVSDGIVEPIPEFIAEFNAGVSKKIALDILKNWKKNKNDIYIEEVRK